MVSMIKDFKDGDGLVAQFLIGNVSKGTTERGLFYLSVDLKDSSGVILGRKWEVSSIDEEMFKPGKILEVSIEVHTYKSSLQAKIYSAKEVEEKDIDIPRFLKMPPVKKSEIVKRYNDYVASIKEPTCKAIIDYILSVVGDNILDCPAAVSVHHDYCCGLLYHTLSMADLAEFIAKRYKDVDRDLLLTGVLLHDLGKTIELEGPIAYKYSLKGKLLGHISIMGNMISRAIKDLDIDNEKSLLLEHMILSHHGELEYGSPVLPLIKEAIILNLVDVVDSKITIVDKALENVVPGDFSQKVFPLDGRILYKPKQ